MIEIDRFLRTSTLASATRQLYSHYLGMFSAWLNIDPAEAAPEHLAGFLDSHPVWSSSTRHNAAAAVRSYYTWRYGKAHPINTLKIKLADPGPQRTLSWEQLDQLLAVLDTTRPTGIRNLSIITMMVDTGLRASELCRLDLRHMDTRNRTFSVIVKGGRWENGCYYDYTASCLANWLGIRSDYALPSTKTVYVSIGGTRPGTTLCKDGLRVLFRRLGERVGFDLSPHDLRRSFATLSSQAGAPTRLVQVAGRWKDIKLVERYTQALKPSDLSPYSPINRLMGIPPTK